MNDRFGGWHFVAGAAVVALLLGSNVSTARAAENLSVEPNSQEFVLEADSYNDTVGLGSLDDLDNDALSFSQHYGPPPPRYQHYHVYRPYWRVRVVAPPLFAPGWFGFYFLGVQPPPPPRPVATTPPPAPRRPDFRHVRQYSLGVTAGAYSGTYYADGAVYNDPGLRFSLSYRNAPVLGAELSIGLFGTNMRYDGMGSDVRSDIPIQMSAVLHAFPRYPIQPYFLFGATGDVRTYRKYDGIDYGSLYSEFRVGPHAGIGIEFLVGQNMSITVDGRSVYYTLIDRRSEGQTFQNDVVATGGLNFYF